MSSFDLNVILRVITSPNSAFAQIRDNEEKYFVQSVILWILASALSVLVVLPFVMIPLDDAYFEGVENIDLPTKESDMILPVGINMLNGIVSVVLFYFIGKKLGSNTDWKKVFSVVFHTYVPVIPMMIAVSMLVFLMWNSLVAIDPSYLMSPNVSEEQIFSVIMPLLGYVGLIAVIAIAFMTWIFVVSVKAINTVNGFGTAKALGLIVLVMIISSIVSAPFGM